MAFKDNFRIEKIYFQRVKDAAETLASWKQNPALYDRAELLGFIKSACDALLMCYRLTGEVWNDTISQIEKTVAELDALKKTAEEYHDELNEKIDGVNNFLNNAIKDLEVRLENVEEVLKKVVIPFKFDVMFEDGNPANVLLLKDGETLTPAELVAAFENGYTPVPSFTDQAVNMRFLFYDPTTKEYTIGFYVYDNLEDNSIISINIDGDNSDYTTETFIRFDVALAIQLQAASLSAANYDDFTVVFNDFNFTEQDVVYWAANGRIKVYRLTGLPGTQYNGQQRFFVSQCQFAHSNSFDVDMYVLTVVDVATGDTAQIHFDIDGNLYPSL